MLTEYGDLIFEGDLYGDFHFTGTFSACPKVVLLTSDWHSMTNITCNLRYKMSSKQANVTVNGRYYIMYIVHC